MSNATAEAPLFDYAAEATRASARVGHPLNPKLHGPARWRLLTVGVVFALAFTAVGGKLMLNAM